jgi:hypothetical protein
MARSQYERRRLYEVTSPKWEHCRLSRRCVCRGVAATLQVDSNAFESDRIVSGYHPPRKLAAPMGQPECPREGLEQRGNSGGAKASCSWPKTCEQSPVKSPPVCTARGYMQWDGEAQPAGSVSPGS